MIIVIIVSGWRGLGGLFRPFIRWRASLGVWGFAIFGMAIIYLISLGVLLAGVKYNDLYWHTGVAISHDTSA